MSRPFRALAAALCLLIAGLAWAADGKKPQPIDELMRKSGLDVQLAQIAPMMVTALTEAAASSTHLDESDVDSIREGIGNAYAPDRLRQAVRTYVAANLSAKDMRAALTWLSSPLGMRLTALEEAAANPDAASEALEEQQRLLASLPAMRQRIIGRLVTATQADEASADVLIAVSIGLMRGLAQRAPSGTIDMEQAKERFAAQREELVASTRPSVMAEEAAIFRDVSDADLRAYIGFAESPSGQKYHAVTRSAVEKAMGAAAQRLVNELAGAKPLTTRAPPDARVPGRSHSRAA